MKIKSEDWINFKKAVISYLGTFEQESVKFDFPVEDESDFTLYVDDCVVYPVFTKKADYLRVEYDFIFCETKIRTLSFSKYIDAVRIEFTLKDRN